MVVSRPAGRRTSRRRMASAAVSRRRGSSLKTSRPGRGGASRRRTDTRRTDTRRTSPDASRANLRRRQREEPERPAMGTPLGEDVLAGRRAVVEALRAGRPLRKVLVSRGARGEMVREIIHEARRRGIAVQFVEPRHLHGGAEAQGVLGLAAARPTVEVDDILADGGARGEPPFVLVLDGVEDPVNLGALIRTAEGAGVHGVIIPRHRAAGLTSAVARASAGGGEEGGGGGGRKRG